MKNIFLNLKNGVVMESKVVSMKPVALYEVKEVLKSRKGEKELNYEQDLTYKFVEKFGKLTEKQTKDLLEDLEKITFLKDNELLKHEVANVVPTRVEQLQLMLPKGVAPAEDELKQVIELTKKFEEKLE
jgi:DNA-directed RNA polymerase subunit F